MGAENIQVFGDSQLIINQGQGEYQGKDDSMIQYLAVAQRLIKKNQEASRKVLYLPGKAIPEILLRPILEMSRVDCRAEGRSVKEGARIGVFPGGTIERSSLAVDPIRNSQTIVSTGGRKGNRAGIVPRKRRQHDPVSGGRPETHQEKSRSKPQEQSRIEQWLSETVPRKNICPEPGATQPVPEPKTTDCSTNRSFASDCSARRDEGSSDDDAASGETDPTPVATPVEPVPPREYTPKVPYPVPAKKSRKDREETKCKKMLEDLTFKLPLMDVIQMMPCMRSLMKGLLKGNQSQVFIMEEAASENDVSDATPKGNNPHLFSYPKTDKLVENAQNSQGQSSGYQKPYQGRTYVLNQAQPKQFQNQKQQTSQQTASSPTTASQDEMKGLATMMQQMLQASHMRQMDVQIVQTAESVKRQQGTLPGKTDRNPKECSAVALRSGRTLPDAVPKKLSAAEKGKQKEAKTSRKNQEETKCKKMLEDLTIKLPRMDAVQMIPSLRSLIKVLISGKITGDSELLLVSKECTAGMIEKILTDDPLELALIRSETRHNVMSVDADGYNKMLDSAKSMEKLVTYLSLGEKDESDQTSHMRQMDVQIAQTAESVKRQQGTLPGKTDKNPKECSAVALRSGRTLPDAVPKKLSAAEKGKQKEAKTSRKDQEETKCKKMLEDLTIKLPRMDAVQMIPSMRSLIKVLISGKITGDSELLLVSKECTAIIPYEMHCGGNTRHRTRDRKGSLRSDRTRVLLGRYVATKSKPKLGRYVATERPFRPIAMQRPSSS
ncbi:hypothetical protein F2Q68_00031394 [Brassica cretica]|uniref:Uncharacterized protein n=1 Tax=Brassica cretica TaxID=69181 RepID=A0A8S9GF51_BRACR|nr:hypothetical protein F2Q68_00031394 [Brassica cretica]